MSSSLLVSGKTSIDAVESWIMEDLQEPTPNQSSFDLEASGISSYSSESPPNTACQSSERVLGIDQVDNLECVSTKTCKPFTITGALPNSSQTDASSEGSTRSSPSRKSSLFAWPSEIICCLFSILCLYAIVEVLLVYNREPSPVFPFGVTINSIVALLSSACSLACTFVVSEGVSQMKWNHYARDKARPLSHLQAFDNASRGIWGSAKLLFVPGTRR